MKLEFDEELEKAFIAILESPAPEGKKKELVVHEFIERNPELIPTPNLLNHHLHFGVVVSKFPLDTSLETDYVYLTKSSDTWKVTFVELEVPDKKMFTNNKKQVDTSSDFNKAIAQVRSWQVFIEENKLEVMRRLNPIFYPIVMRRNPVEFDYQLIIGRSDEKNESPERIKILNRLRKETGINIMTYDTLLNYYRNSERYKKDILSLSKNKMKFKYIHTNSTMLFSYVSKDEFILTSNQKESFKLKGYEIDEWEQGKSLAVNGKQTMKNFSLSCTLDP
ncbi:Shedu immune nuclease family protein [Psychrobacter proteolyticus]|uniref:Shedu immune nuclease family protein n=1 Tax=Psychrobacter proteolyticus TaxID=147825 RepID=UPI003D002D12